MDYHVRTGLENVPLHAWNIHDVTRILGGSCSLDYIEAKSVRKECTELLWVWAWTENPSLIPKVNRVTLPARSPQATGSRARGRRGLRLRVLLHLAIVEDFTTEDANGNPPRPYALPFQRGDVDGEGSGSRRRVSPQRSNDRRGRRDDDDERDGRGGRNRSRSWGAALRSSLSRAPREDRDGGRDA
jgi:hypothetical protein